MIRIDRGPEPPELTTNRAARLPAMRALAATREPTSVEIDGYQVAKPALVRAQTHKCCYCEWPDYRTTQERWRRAQRRLLRQSHPFAALAHDALAVLVSGADRAAWGLDLPRPPIE